MGHGQTHHMIHRCLGSRTGFRLRRINCCICPFYRSRHIFFFRLVVGSELITQLGGFPNLLIQRSHLRFERLHRFLIHPLRIKGSQLPFKGRHHFLNPGSQCRRGGIDPCLQAVNTGLKTFRCHLVQLGLQLTTLGLQTGDDVVRLLDILLLGFRRGRFQLGMAKQHLHGLDRVILISGGVVGQDGLQLIFGSLGFHDPLLDVFRSDLSQFSNGTSAPR